MNSLKTLLMVAILGAVAYGAYVTMTRNVSSPTGAADSAPPWSAPPKVQLGSASPQAASGAGTPLGANPAAMTAGGPTVVMPGPSPSLPPGIAGPTSTNVSSIPVAATGAAFMPPGPSAPPAGTTAQGPVLPYASSEPTAAASGGAAAAGEASGAGDRPGDVAYRAGTLPGGVDPFAAPRQGAATPFAAVMQQVQAQLDGNRLAEAHYALSQMYGDPSLAPADAQRVTELLDQLAGTVIYSQQHLLDQPYRVQPGDTLERIGQTYQVPWQLLARINGIADPQQLQPNQELKVFQGPFTAVIDLTKHEMTLMLRGLYAGRFPIGVGLDCPRLEGNYVVCSQTADPEYYGPDQSQIPAGDPRNPLGRYWIGLGEQVGQPGTLGIHGTNDPKNVQRTGGRGAICLGDQDIDDVYHILSLGSKVVIRR